MIATLAMSSIDSNSAGARLPILPRRSASAGRISFPTTTPQKATPPIKLVVQQATPPSDDDSSSTAPSDSPVTIRPKRSRGVRPPEQSTPLPFAARRPPSPLDEDTPRPSVRPLVYSPGAGAISGLRALSTSHIPTFAPPPSPSNDPPRIVRKKSGEPLKSSLKSSTPRVRGSLAVVINGAAGSSKSAPNTPTTGTRARVHFNSQLEQVKLFLAEQKPLAVSRDGSPTDDTSGTEDFPDFVFGRDQGVLEMLVVVPPPEGEVDVKLQTLVLAEDKTSVAGTVAVRNLAFDKWVAVRFSLDDWQTTSEVTARYSHSQPGGMVDVFLFNIRLNDILARIDGKQMALAVRYNSAGREMWDNNGGRNYLATFKRVRGGSEPAKAKEGEVAADLRSRLERVVKTQEEHDPQAAIGFRAGGSLAARYDFNSSSRAPWRPHQRAQSHPNFDLPSPPNTVPWPRAPSVPQKPRSNLGSPRDTAEDASFRPGAYISSSDSENHPFALPKPGSRQHQRGYFDVPLRDIGLVRRTPPGTPRLAKRDDTTPLASPGRYNSYPPLDPRGVGLGLEFEVRPLSREENGSDDSTPSFVSSDGTTSPMSPPDFGAIEGRLGLEMGSAGAEPSTYHNFLDKFCFYTGPGSADIISIPRTQSASSVEELLSVVSASPRLRALVSPPSSGSSTPTSSSSVFNPMPSYPSESRAATPVAAA
ncbi:putative phosphatase regulatory subunit-domain-containing protein [Mycena amicta]|nr:putative phosphatase regulatory subunit-domain-containing protein [Mycena amicta]